MRRQLAHRLIGPINKTLITAPGKAFTTTVIRGIARGVHDPLSLSPPSNPSLDWKYLPQAYPSLAIHASR
jgi:hypothetical protein